MNIYKLKYKNKVVKLVFKEFYFYEKVLILQEFSYKIMKQKLINSTRINS